MIFYIFLFLEVFIKDTALQLIVSNDDDYSKAFVLITIKLQINDKSTFYETTTHEKITLIVDQESVKATIH